MHNTDIEKSNQRIIGIDESKYIYSCGCHVISCCKVFPIFSIGLSAITLLYILFSHYLSADYLDHFAHFFIYFSMVNAVIDILLNAGVLYGIYRIKPVALLPYIIVKTFFLIIIGFSIIIGLIIAVSAFTDNAATRYEVFFGAIGLGVIGIGGAICFLFLVAWYFLMIFGGIVIYSISQVFLEIIVGASVLGGLFFIAYLFVQMFYRAYDYLKEVEDMPELGRYATVDEMQNVPTYKLLNMHGFC